MILFGLWEFLFDLFHLILDTEFIAFHLPWSLWMMEFAFGDWFGFGMVFEVLLGLGFSVDIGSEAFFGVEFFAFLESVTKNWAVLLMGLFMDFLNMLKVLFVFL